MSDESILNDIEQFDRESFLYDMARGRHGLNQGLDNGLGRANEFLYGVQQGTGYLFGADSGVGKTTFCDETCVLTPFFDAKVQGKKIKFLYFSWELDKKRKKLRFASRLMCRMYGLRLPTAYLLGKGKFRCSDEHWNLAVSIEPVVEEIFGSMEMVDEPCNSRTVKRIMKEFAKKYGTFQSTQMQGEDGEVHEIITGYTPADPELQIMCIFDHISLADADVGMTLKQSIDEISKSCVYFRNRCGWSYAIIQQFSSEMQTTDRRKLDKGNVIPMRNDFGDSKYTYRDADVVWGFICPKKFGFDEFKGYDVSKLRSSYIHGFLMKNRDGPDGVSYPFFLDPVAHSIEVLPNPAFDLADRLPTFYDKSDILHSELDKVDFSDQVIIKQLN